MDALSGKPDYKRGIGNYSRSFHVPMAWKGRRIFIRFEGANAVTDLFLNGKHVGEHRGGYGAFIFELTDLVTYGAENKLLVRVNNAEQLDVMPLVGDFNFYGGIYREVALMLTNDVCISPLDYASPGGKPTYIPTSCWPTAPIRRKKSASQSRLSPAKRP